MKGNAGAALTILLLSACAQVREVTGGEADSKGPVLISSEPPALTTRFASEHILLRFDERVQVEAGRDRLLVSPPLDTPPTIRVVRANEVEIGLNASLRPNTTYTFSLDGAVKDLSEGNYAAGMEYVVSTGDALDSLAIMGGVINAFTGAQEKSVLVMVHAASDTTDFTNSRPLYATRTDSSGAFRLRHMAAGNYLLTALHDQNANYRYDLPNERIAFAMDTVAATTDPHAAPITLRMFQERSAVQTLREATVTDDGAWRLVFARPAEHVLVDDIARSGGVLTWAAEWSNTRDTVLLWPSDTMALGDGLYAIVTENGALDTLRYRPLRKMPFFTKLDVNVREEGAMLTVELRSSRPIVSTDGELFLLRQDSTAVPFTITESSADRRHLLLTTLALPRGTNAQFTLLPKAVHDIYGGYNDTLRVGIGRSAEVRTGTLRVTVASASRIAGSPLLQLLDGQGRSVRAVTLDPVNAHVVWEHLAPGNHGLRLIEDQNGNGRWDTGQWDLGKQPERVWYYTEPLNVRAAWDLGIDWELVLP